MLEGWRRRQGEGFASDWYLRHNQRRQEHLASLRLPLERTRVLEVGAGIGDHTSFFIDRGCDVTITEARPESVTVLRERYPDRRVLALDLDAPGDVLGEERFDVVYCYGVLYHLKDPRAALGTLSAHCKDLLLLETCVSFGDEEEQHPVPEPALDPSQAFHGQGCRPTRPWVYHALTEQFRFVYLPKTQPWHPEFPVVWTGEPQSALTRAVFIASRSFLDNDQLLDVIPQRQARH
jgi:SAM-dependent methyltransferase